MEITVNRNLEAPVFVGEETYAATINENVGGGNEVTRVVVTDADEKVGVSAEMFVTKYCIVCQRCLRIA